MPSQGIRPEDLSDPLADIENMMFERPRDAVRAIQQDTIRQMTQMYQSAQNTDRYFREFYAQNPDIPPSKHHLVTTIVQQMISEDPSLEGKPASETYGPIAERVRSELGAPEVDPEQAVMQGFPADGEAFSEQKTSRKQGTLGDVIRDRKRQRYESQRRFKYGVDDGRNVRGS